MRFDWSSCAVGVIAGVGAILSVIFAVQLDIFVDTPICAEDENGLTCARSWVNVLAIFAGAGTIFILAREQADARRNRRLDERAALENAIFTSLPVRACLADAAATANVIDQSFEMFETARSQIQNFGLFFRDMRTVVDPLRKAHKLLGRAELQRAAEYEGSFAFRIEQLQEHLSEAASILYDEDIDLSELDGAAFTARPVPNWQRMLTDGAFDNVVTNGRQLTAELRRFEAAVRMHTLQNYFSQNVDRGAD